MVRIILIRHGETQWNIEGRYQGQEDTHLSERGLRQGHMVAQGLKDTPIDAAISSPLERSYMTCAFCAKLHGLDVLKDDRLLEINHGDWEGRLADDIEAQYPTEFHQWHTEPHLVTMPGRRVPGRRAPPRPRRLRRIRCGLRRQDGPRRRPRRRKQGDYLRRPRSRHEPFLADQAGQYLHQRPRMPGRPLASRPAEFNKSHGVFVQRY